MTYQEMSKDQLQKELDSLKVKYEEYCKQGLSLDLTRGKPEAKQLDLSTAMFDTLKDGFIQDGTDTRNYGLVDGLPSCKKLFAEYLGCSEENVFVGGNASLELMYAVFSFAYHFGLKNSERPWSQEKVVKFLCPVPGYDRHFNMSLEFGMECIPVPMNEDGPDMDIVESLIKDPSVKGIWNVPKYSNPDGFVYSEQVCRRMAAMTPAAKDFVIMWDNAYCLHVFDGPLADLPDIVGLCKEAGHPDMVFEFASTSKVTYSGAGVACLAANADNLAWFKKHMGYATIGFNKINQMVHVRFLKDKATTMEHMKKHAALLAPKFNAVVNTLKAEVGPTGVAKWSEPKGGYFVSLYNMPGTATRVHALCKAAGVVLTAAGASYPGGKDPDDSHIRIAPTFAPLENVQKACKVLSLSIRIAALEKLLG